LTNSLGIELLFQYEEIKKCILKENRLTALQHRANFEKCEKEAGENYVQWGARVKTSLDYYLESRQVKTFETLKDLIVTDKIKEGLPKNVRSHILVKEGDAWFNPVKLTQEVDLFIEACPRGFENPKKDYYGRNE
jgi:hypothetical protein